MFEAMHKRQMWTPKLSEIIDINGFAPVEIRSFHFFTPKALGLCTSLNRARNLVIN